MPAYPEMFMTYGPTGTPLGLVARSEVHRRGLWHKAVNVLVFRSDRRLLLQRRAAEKDVGPNLWDLSVGEHLQPGESYTSGAARGLHEELGLRNVALTAAGPERRFTTDLPERDVRDYEMQRTYLGCSDAEVQLDPVEVAAIDEVTLMSLQAAMTSRPQRFTPWFRETAERIGLFERAFADALDQVANG